MAAFRSSLLDTVSSQDTVIFVAVRSPKIEDNVFREIDVDPKQENAHGQIFRNT